MSFPNFEEECLAAHNALRQQHGVPPLVLCPTISAGCRAFAKELVAEPTLRNGNAPDLGENIYAVRSSNPDVTITGDQPVTNWTSKSVQHDFSKEPEGDSLPAGNFTQMVWKESAKLGVGYAKLEGKIVVVTRYSPAGNVMGRFCANVFPSDAPQVAVCPPAPRVGAPATVSTFQQECLDAHNAYRAKHGVGALQLNGDMCAFSQEWADKLAADGAMKHRTTSKYGENIFSMWSSDPQHHVAGGRAVDAWYDEIALYKSFDAEPTDLKAGHFTQVVWRSSQQLGVGVARKDGHVYVVCNYLPPGNYVGEYVKNISAPL